MQAISSRLFSKTNKSHACTLWCFAIKQSQMYRLTPRSHEHQISNLNLHYRKYPDCLCKCWPSLSYRLVGGWLDVVGRVGDAPPPCVALHPEGGWVELTPLEDFVSQQAARLPVLVTEQRVDKWVARCFAVSQTFGQHTPVRAYGPWSKKLDQSTSNKAKGRTEVTHTLH